MKKNILKLLSNHSCWGQGGCRWSMILLQNEIEMNTVMLIFAMKSIFLLYQNIVNRRMLQKVHASINLQLFTIPQILPNFHSCVRGCCNRLKSPNDNTNVHSVSGTYSAFSQISIYVQSFCISKRKDWWVHYWMTHFHNAGDFDNTAGLHPAW